MQPPLILRIPRCVAPAVVLALFTLPVVTAAPRKQGQSCPPIEPMPPAAYTTFFGQQFRVAARSPQWQVRLAEWSPSAWPPQHFTFELKNQTTGASSQMRLSAWDPASEGLRLNQIDEMGIFADKLLILGRAAANSSEAAIVELPTGRILDRFPCFMPAFSPDHQFLAFLKSFPGHPGPSSVTAEYLVYSLALSPDENRAHSEPGVAGDAGWAVYPPHAINAAGSNLVPGLDAPVHWISSARLLWLGVQTLVFTDHYPNEDTLVAVDLGKLVRPPIVRTKTLNPNGLIDFGRCKSSYSAEDLKRLSSDPSALIRVLQIAPIPGAPGWVCLRFEPHPCLAHSELALKLP